MAGAAAETRWKLTPKGEALVALMKAPAAPGAAFVEEADRRLADAMLHYSIGFEAMSAGLPVDWEYVACRMAMALCGVDEEVVLSNTSSS